MWHIMHEIARKFSWTWSLVVSPLPNKILLQSTMTITRHINEIGTLATKYHAEIYFGFIAIHKASFY
jgi:hypothetical protein